MSSRFTVAVWDACRQLNERLAPVRAQLKDPTFAELVNAAYVQRIDLSAHGFYTTPGITGATPRHPLPVAFTLREHHRVVAK